MTTITFGFYALKPLEDGRTPVHMYLKRLEPTYTESPGEEHKAMKDALIIINEIAHASDGEAPEDSRLLQDGEPPSDAYPLMQFAIGVSWDRSARVAHYTKICHQRVAWDGRWTPVATVAMDLYEYIFSVLRKREKEVREKRAASSAKQS